jgi:hypothetical protein
MFVVMEKKIKLFFSSLSVIGSVVLSLIVELLMTRNPANTSGPKTGFFANTYTKSSAPKCVFD